MFRFIGTAQCRFTETINRFLDTMPDGEGQCKIFDVNLRQGFYTKEILCNSMKKCNILKINDEELVTVSRMFGYPGIDLQDKCWILLAKYNFEDADTYLWC